jgi:hypothetical protein
MPRKKNQENCVCPHCGKAISEARLAAKWATTLSAEQFRIRCPNDGPDGKCNRIVQVDVEVKPAFSVSAVA